MPKEVDVVVIGSGVGGLSCAAMLARCARHLSHKQVMIKIRIDCQMCEVVVQESLCFVLAFALEPMFKHISPVTLADVYTPLCIQPSNECHINFTDTAMKFLWWSLIQVQAVPRTIGVVASSTSTVVQRCLRESIHGCRCPQRATANTRQLQIHCHLF